VSRIYVNGRVHVRRRQCATCVFRPADRGRLPGITDDRVTDLVEANADSALACHSHLYEGAEVEPVCRGFFDLRRSPILRLAEMMDVVEWVE